MTRDCGADYENRIVAGRHPRVGRDCPGAMKTLAVFGAFAAAVRLFNSTALTKHSISLRLRIFALRKIVEKEIDRSNATVPGDNKIGSRVSWWFAGSARYPSNPSGIT